MYAKTISGCRIQVETVVPCFDQNCHSCCWHEHGMCEHSFLVSQLYSISFLFCRFLLFFWYMWCDLPVVSLFFCAHLFFSIPDKRQLPHINMVNIHAVYKHKTLQKLSKNYQSSFHWNWTVLNSHHDDIRVLTTRPKQTKDNQISTLGKLKLKRAEKLNNKRRK